MRGPALTRPVAAVVVFVLLAAAPGGAADPDPQVLADGVECFAAMEGTNGTCSVLYAHLDLDVRFPALGVQPVPEYAPDVRWGTGLPVVQGVWDGEVVLRPTTGRIEWDDSGRYQLVSGPPVAEPTPLADGPIIGYWYMSAEASESGPFAGADPPSVAGALPCLMVQMDLVDRDRGSDTWRLLARGSTTRTVVSQGVSEPEVLPTDDPCPGAEGPVTADDAHEFRVLLQRLPGAPEVMQYPEVIVRWYQVEPETGTPSGNQVGQRDWQIRTGPGFRPRVVLPIEEPVRVVSSTLYRAGDLLGPTVRFISTWGSIELVTDPLTGRSALTSDYQAETIRFRVLDADGRPVEMSTVEGPRFKYYLGHGIGDDLLNVTYTWDPSAEPDLAPGTYTLVVEADNLQGTATARAEMAYVHEAEPDREAPIVLMPVIFVLALLLVAGRRWTDRDL